MANEENIFWDTTKHSTEYPDIIKKIYFKMILANRKSFTKWIGDISKKFNNDIDWWVTLPLTRDSNSSNLFHYICLLKTLEILKGRKKSIIIKVNSKSLFDIIKIWSKSNNFSINIDYVKKNRKLSEYLIIFKSIIFNFFIFFYIKSLTKKININEDIKENVLIDTFGIKESIYNERFYKGIDLFLNKKKINHVFFVPTFIIENNLLNVTKIIRALNHKNYLFKEHYLKFADIIFAHLHFLRVKNYIKKFKSYSGWNLSAIICEEITSTKDYPSKVNAILNYKFAKNLYDSKISIKKTVNWFENQIADKGWNLGFRKYFKKIRTYGYQGFLHVPHFMHLFPAKHEEESKVIPSEIIVVGKAYKNVKKEFFPKVKVSIGPALNYLDIFKTNSKSRKINVLVILTGIKLLDAKLLEWVSVIEEINKKLKVIIKPHPILPIDKIISNGNLSRNFVVSNEKLSSLLQKSKTVICSGPTSATIESIAYGCFLLVPVMDAYDEFTLKTLNISKNKYCLIYNKTELAKIIKREIKKKNLSKISNLKLKKFLFENISKKNLKYYY